ncbi:reverse transcriptase N-terminal domain-containing protein [Streptomyces sp. NPDC006476]|uniref:reverse transcriptase N-terminal domain-containing protein n=1 Tax=Streptomyces sp. NPDC006476 TaxID=3157175 RepID=UPI0033BE6BC7
MNGPKDAAEWDDVAWRHHEDNVVRLRQRIFKATREEDWALVRSLQQLMLRSWSNTLPRHHQRHRPTAPPSDHIHDLLLSAGNSPTNRDMSHLVRRQLVMLKLSKPDPRSVMLSPPQSA